MARTKEQEELMISLYEEIVECRHKELSVWKRLKAINEEEMNLRVLVSCNRAIEGITRQLSAVALLIEFLKKAIASKYA